MKPLNQNKMVWCFRCNKVKPADEFKNNHRGYQIKSRQGKVFSCNPCSHKWILDNLKAVRFDFENSTWIVHSFENTNEAIKFLEYEDNNRIRRQS
jgi:hypothetical protein